MIEPTPNKNRQYACYGTGRSWHKADKIRFEIKLQSCLR